MRSPSKARRRMGQLNFDAHWTWTSNYLNYQNIEDPYAPLRWSHDQYSSKFRAVISADWSMPFDTEEVSDQRAAGGRFRAGRLAHLLGLDLRDRPVFHA